jgi:hypothetical protein
MYVMVINLGGFDKRYVYDVWECVSMENMRGGGHVVSPHEFRRILNTVVLVRARSEVNPLNGWIF